MALTPASTMNPPKERRSILGWLMRKVFLSPFKWTWRFATRVEKRVGIFITLLSGVVLFLIGSWLISTVLGFLIGLPMVIVGAALVLRALY